MAFKVVPFNAGITRGEGADQAATQLESLINQQQVQGWEFRGLETLQTVVTTPAVAAVPGSNGCFGIGYKPGIPGRPEARNTTQVYVAVFAHEE